MAMVRVVALAAAVLGVSFALAACGGESGGTTTVATQPPPETTSEPEETTSKPEETTAKEKTTPEKTSPEKAAGKAEKGGASSAELAEGEQVFTANGCGSCHTLAAANASGVVGPNLDETLPGKSASYIRESIVDPNANVPSGYSPGIMPSTFGSSLSSAELNALVAFLQQSAGQ